MLTKLKKLLSIKNSKFSLNEYKNSPLACFKFSYTGFKTFKQKFENNKSYSINIGDYIQSFAVRNICQNLTDKNVLSLDRDTLNKYNGEKIKLFMNTVFFSKIFKFSKNIFPIFLGINLTDDLKIVKRHKNILRKYQPIGCRDIETAELLKKNKIDAFVTGCYSLCLPKREFTPEKRKIFFVGISEELKKCIPNELLKDAVFIIQREEVAQYPLTDSKMQEMDQKAEQLIERYKNEATLVVTSLLHCASPCIGMGIPVILARDEYDPRFSAISKITKLYLKEDYAKIDWNPKAIDVEELKANMLKISESKIKNNEIDKDAFEYLQSFYRTNTWSKKMPHWALMEERIKLMLSLIDLSKVKSIMDIGCGHQNTKKYIPEDVSYIPVDFIKYNDSVIQKDFNAGEFHFQKVDVAFCSGIFEYIYDMDAFVEKISKCSDTILASYIFYGNREKPDYVVNKYTKNELLTIFEKYGYKHEHLIPEDKARNIGRNTVFLLKR